jgi:competence protein ComGC
MHNPSYTPTNRSFILNRSRVHGISLLELLTTLAIVSCLVLLLSLGIRHSRDYAKTTNCLSNLRQIHQAIMLYRVEHQEYPVISTSKSLVHVLSPWLASSDKIFHCPEDHPSNLDSYSYFYAPRSLTTESEAYMLGCPRHQSYSHGVTIYAGAYTELDQVAPVSHNGHTAKPGEEFDYGEFVFADGSKASVGMGIGNSITKEQKNNSNSETKFLPTLSTVTSIRQPDGKIYTIIKMKEGSMGTARFSIVPGNRFEVITPAAIIAVRGTEFSIETLKHGNKHGTRVQLFSGVVEMHSTGKIKSSLKLENAMGKNQALAVEDESLEYE